MCNEKSVVSFSPTKLLIFFVISPCFFRKCEKAAARMGSRLFLLGLGLKKWGNVGYFPKN